MFILNMFRDVFSILVSFVTIFVVVMVSDICFWLFDSCCLFLMNNFKFEIFLVNKFEIELFIEYG